MSDIVKRLTDRISYIPCVAEPLSSDVVIVRGDSRIYIYDVGNNPAATEYLNSLKEEKYVVISHFHEDHTKKLTETHFDKLFVGNQTYKSLGMGDVVSSVIKIEDGIKLDIIPCPSSHSKGSLLLMIDDTYLLTGDSMYCASQNGRAVYNVSLLNEQIKLLDSLPADKYFLSHRKGQFYAKGAILMQLSLTYRKRLPGEAYINA